MFCHTIDRETGISFVYSVAYNEFFCKILLPPQLLVSFCRKPAQGSAIKLQQGIDIWSLDDIFAIFEDRTVKLGYPSDYSTINSH